VSDESLGDCLSPWLEWFLSQPQHDFFCEVDEDYLLDRFNLTGLTSAGPHFQLALDRMTMMTNDAFEEDTQRIARLAITAKQTHEQVPSCNPAINLHDSCHHVLEDNRTMTAESNTMEERVEAQARQLRAEVQASAAHLYGLIHARYILTSQGLAKMVSPLSICSHYVFYMHVLYSMKNSDRAILANARASIVDHSVCCQ
jgi:Casein kinase II regulatory subunit